MAVSELAAIKAIKCH